MISYDPPTDPEETIWMASSGNSRHSIHFNEQCPRKTDSANSWSLGSVTDEDGNLFDRYGWCSFCKGEVQPEKHPRTDAYRALEQGGPDDLPI